MREVLSSLDIGSSKIKLVVAEVLNDEFNIICALEEKSRGVKKGAIYNPDDVEYAIKKLLKKAEEALGFKINKLIVSVNEDSCSFKVGEAQIDISDEGEVHANSIQKVLQQSYKGALEAGNELVTIIPIKYVVDDQVTISPKGMKGNSLQVRSVVVSVPKRDIYDMAKIIEKCNCEVVDVMIPSIGAFYAHKEYIESKNSLIIKDKTGIIVDIGAETTNIGVINKGIIINNIVLDFGGSLIDQDISFIYKIDMDKAKEIKERFAVANKRKASALEKEEVVNSLGEKVTINQFELSEVCRPRLQEILKKIKNEINDLTKKEISYIIITGGLTEFNGFSLEVESVFGNLAKVGSIKIIGARDNKYANAIGMIKYFHEKLRLRDKEYSMLNQEELDSLSGIGKNKNNSSILNKVFGMFFEN